MNVKVVFEYSPICKAVWPLILVASTLAVILTNFLTAFSFPYLAALPFKINNINLTTSKKWSTLNYLISKCGGWGKNENQNSSNQQKWLLILNFSEFWIKNWFTKGLVKIPCQRRPNLLKTKCVGAGFLVWSWGKVL